MARRWLTRLRVSRLVDGPIISPETHPSIGVNIQGPSLIRVPDWVEGRLGLYYLYFADHKGSYIRLAYADALVGPWHVHSPGSLQLAQSRFLTSAPVPSADELAAFEARYRANGMAISHDVLSEITTPHIASPDVHDGYGHVGGSSCIFMDWRASDIRSRALRRPGTASISMPVRKYLDVPISGSSTMKP